jgi:protein SCO1
MTRPTMWLLLLGLGLASPSAAEEYDASGMVVRVDRTAATFTASIDAIPGYMRAMTMPFDVQDARELDGLAPGAMVEFTLVVQPEVSYARRIRIVRYENVEPDPFAASRLALLNDLVAGDSAVPPLALGETVPDFRLTDQRGRSVALADLRGKVVAVNFIYTSCVLPDYCLRLANHFGVLQKRFAPRLGRDLVLLTITFDPTHDTPEVLAGYAEQWKADASTWHFLTGSDETIRWVCRLFGVQAFAEEGLMAHSLHTVLIDRRGQLLANIEGNRFTADQLADLTERALD